MNAHIGCCCKACRKFKSARKANSDKVKSSNRRYAKVVLQACRNATLEQLEGFDLEPIHKKINEVYP